MENRLNNINFEECLKRHYPMSYNTFKIQALMQNISLEDYTLEIVEDCKGEFELADVLMGAYLMHIAKGNIEGKDLDEEIINNMIEYNFSQEFINDIKRNIK